MNTQFNTDIRASVEARRVYEIAKNANCDSMLDTLKSFDKTLTNDALVALLAATNIDADVLNRSERNNARFNVYAFEKILRDVSVSRVNHYSAAIIRAAIAIEASELDSKTLNHSDAVAACSLDAKHKDSKRANVIKSARYQKHVALNTATTQSSSSLNSLCALNVLRETRDAANNIAYTLNRESELTAKLIAQVSA